MVEIHYTMKELARILYIVDNYRSDKKSSEAVYEAKYKRLLADLEAAGLYMEEEVPHEAAIRSISDSDMKLLWKTKLILETLRKEREDEDEDDEDDPATDADGGGM